MPDEEPTYKDRKKIAEIKFAALIAEKNIPFQTAESILSLFQELGKDPIILENMVMNRKKGPEIINKVLYVREQERLVETLQNNKFSIFINETSDITEKWITFVVRYVDPQTSNVRTELLELIRLDANDCSVEKLFTTLRDVMWEKKIPFQNILALSCDNASIMTGKYEFLKIKLQEYCENLITMPCPCHASASAANAACAAIPKACEELLRKVASFISGSPKRVCTFQQLRKSFAFRDNDRKMFKQSEMRWISRYSCVAKLNENWNALLKCLQEEQLNEKSKSKAVLLTMMRNPEIRAYFLFLEYILKAFNKFHASFESQDTKVYLLQPAAEDLLRSVVRNVVKNKLLDSAISGVIDPFLACNRLSSDQVIVGRACQEFLNRLNRKGRDDIVKSIYANCFLFYNIAAKEIREKIFVKEEFLSKLRIFDLKFALQRKDEDNSVQDVLFVAKRFDEFDEEMLQKEWQSLNLDFALEQKEKITVLDFDNAWKTITEEADGKFKYPMLTKLVNIIRSLPNSNTASETIFSILRDVKSKKRNNLCPHHVKALCVLKSSLRLSGQTAQTLKIDARHLALMSSDTKRTSNVNQIKCEEIKVEELDLGDL